MVVSIHCYHVNCLSVFLKTDGKLPTRIQDNHKKSLFHFILSVNPCGGNKLVAQFSEFITRFPEIYRKNILKFTLLGVIAREQAAHFGAKNLW